MVHEKCVSSERLRVKPKAPLSPGRMQGHRSSAAASHTKRTARIGSAITSGQRATGRHRSRRIRSALPSRKSYPRWARSVSGRDAPWREPACLEDAPDGKPYLRVRGGGPGGETDAHPPLRQPIPLLDFLPDVQRRTSRLVADEVAAYAVTARYVVALRDPLGGDDRQVVGVRGVVAADDDGDVQRVLEQPEERILPVLGRRADGVEELEVLLEVLLPVALGHRFPQFLADRHRLAHEHRGLVGDAYALEVGLRIEAGAHAVAELLFEFTGARSAQDEVHDVAGLFEVAHDQVLPVAALLRGLRGGGLRLLVVVLAVDDAREALLGVPRNALPHREDRAAGRVHHDAVPLFKFADPIDRRAEGREEHHVLGGQAVEGLFGGAVEAPGEELYAHLAQPVVHGGVVDHVPRYVDAPVRELLLGLEGVVHRPIHPVAEPELVGETQNKTVGFEDVAVLADPVHDLRAVVSVQEVLDVIPHLEALTIILLLRHAHLSYPTFVPGSHPGV